MTYNPDIHHRRSIRLKEYDYSQAGYYYITIITKNRIHFFGKIDNGKMILNESGLIVKSVWEDLPNHYQNIDLDVSVIMPNHFHGIIVINDNLKIKNEMPIPKMNIKQRRKMTLSKVIGRFKMVSSKQINKIQNTQTQFVWHRNYYEHIIRDELSYKKISNYILNNPMNWSDDDYKELQ